MHIYFLVYYTYIKMAHEYETCEYCNHKSKIHFHRINKKMVNAFLKLYNHSKVAWRTKLKNLNLEISDHNNFQKMQHFWIVERDSWWYLPTQLWVEFVLWNSYIRNRVATLNNKRLSNEHRCWEKKSEEFKPKRISIIDVVDSNYKTLEEYSRDAIIDRYF